jgi:hypothetical protein
VKKLWLKLDWDDQEPPDLNAPETWNELNVETCADEIARVYLEERRKKMSRPGQKNSAKKS